MVEVVSEVPVGIEITMLEEEKTIDGEVDHLSQRLTASLERAEEL